MEIHFSEPQGVPGNETIYVCVYIYTDGKGWVLSNYVKITKIAKMLPRTYENAWYYCYSRPLAEKYFFYVEITIFMVKSENMQNFTKIYKNMQFS